MWGFETFPHDKPMNIEEPASVAKAQDFIWRLPLSVNTTNSYVKHFTTTATAEK
jgi:hypothetical protein